MSCVKVSASVSVWVFPSKMFYEQAARHFWPW